MYLAGARETVIEQRAQQLLRTFSHLLTRASRHLTQQVRWRVILWSLLHCSR